MEIVEVMQLVAVALALLVGAGLLVLACRRSPEDDPRFAEVLDLIAWLLDRLERAVGRLEDLCQAEVEAAARAVYSAQVTGTDLNEFVAAGATVGQRWGSPSGSRRPALARRLQQDPPHAHLNRRKPR
jgi:hypothetical protein